MREILFRAKTNEDILREEKWIYGYFIDEHITGLSPYIKSIDDSLEYEVSSETVGQHTGLTDRKGVKIFEGDIIRFYDDETGDYEDGEIFWNKSECCFNVRWESDNVTEFDTFEARRSEAIGNIYDNPELLEVKA